MNKHDMQQAMILILSPLKWFGIVVAELKRVDSYGQFMMVSGTVRSSQVDASQQPDLHELATLCEELRPDSLYVQYANSKMFRHEADFWATKEKAVKQHVKRMADRRIVKAVGLADKMDIPILYAKGPKTPLHITDRLTLKDCKDSKTHSTVTPVMNFSRHDGGTTYKLQLRIDGRLVETLSEHHPVVLTYEPGLFAIDGRIHVFDEGFSAQLLLPFISKQQVEIPANMENDYFHRFILKHVARAEVNAEGFDITDISTTPRACLTAETSVDGSHIVSLKFGYGSLSYTPESKSNGRVTLTETADGFRFVRQLRRHDEECRMAEVLREVTGMDGSIVRFPSAGKMIDWLRNYAPRLKNEGFDVVQPSDHPYYIGPLSVEQSDTWRGDWLQTDVTVVVERASDQTAATLDDQIRLPFLALRDTILRGEREYMLPTGEVLLIPNEWLQRYSDLLLVGMPKGNGMQLHKSQVKSLNQGSISPKSLTPSPSPRERGVDSSSAMISAYTGNNSPLLGRGSGGEAFTLRPYQMTGLQWLWQNFVAQTGCCLSDEMGLGKTLQTIALLLCYKETTKKSQPEQTPAPGMLFSEEEMRGDIRRETGGVASPLRLPYLPSLVVAPASVVHNWRNELARFAPSLSVMTYTGDAAKRREMLRGGLQMRSLSTALGEGTRGTLASERQTVRADVVLTSYRTLLNDIGQLSQNEFGIVVFDESQAFKTATSQIHHAVTKIKALHRMALSGTPVENNLQELWSLMNVLNPNLLGDERSFRNAFINPIAEQSQTSKLSGEPAILSEQDRRELLRRLIAPYFLKRTKEEVLNDLPERQDEVVVCTMTDEQARRYAEELSKARNEWLDPATNSQKRQINILAALQRLRQIANGEGKLSVVFDHLENLRQTNHKVLIFSEYVSLLELVGCEMTRRGWDYSTLTGETRDREQVIARFQETAGCQFFLISLKAGGVGLNLTAADYVFLLDPWWNRAAEEQAIARAHRIGQQRSVFVYRFVSAGTLEEQILSLQDRKQSLIDSVMPFVL